MRQSSLSPIAIAVLLVVLAAPRPAAAGSWPEPNHLYDQFQIGAFGSQVLIGPKVRVDSESGSEGTEISTGNVLGIDRSAFEPQFTIRWRPGRRHEIQAGYLFLSREGEKRLTRDVDIRDTTFTAGLNISTLFGADNATLAYRYALTAKENTQIGAQLGLGAIFFDINVDALAGAGNGNDTLTTSFGAGASLTGPTAALGLYGRFRVGNRWYLDGNVGGIGIKIENITATVFQGSVAGRYFLSERFGLEAGYGLTTVRIEIDKAGGGGLFDPTVAGSIRYPYQDFRLGVVAAFH